VAPVDFAKLNIIIEKSSIEGWLVSRKLPFDIDILNQHIIQCYKVQT